MSCLTSGSCTYSFVATETWLSTVCFLTSLSTVIWRYFKILKINLIMFCPQPLLQFPIEIRDFLKSTIIPFKSCHVFILKWSCIVIWSWNRSSFFVCICELMRITLSIHRAFWSLKYLWSSKSLTPSAACLC